jgi:hypothetical protein
MSWGKKWLPPGLTKPRFDRFPRRKNPDRITGKTGRFTEVANIYARFRGENQPVLGTGPDRYHRELAEQAQFPPVLLTLVAAHPKERETCQGRRRPARNAEEAYMRYGKCAARLGAAIDLVMFTVVDPTGKRGCHTCCQCRQRMGGGAPDSVSRRMRGWPTRPRGGHCS